jgi:hypothetical protein
LSFRGPSLPRGEREPYPGILWQPPCAAGDLLRLDTAPGDTICIIDGWFDHRPAVRHKEILELLSRGVRILGASSMGALRAAEMEAFGMIGVGAIFRAYASGWLTGDDEVALAHGPIEWDWRPLSVPLVDVRATLHHALRTRALAREEIEALMRAAVGLHYVDRTWPDVMDSAALNLPARRRVAAWVKQHSVGQKNLDAHACLAATNLLRGAPVPPVTPVRTVFLATLASSCGVRLPVPAPDRPARPANGDVPHVETGCGSRSIA